jgi:8-oxo-dGTP pyrophosphatase MutT (NUDIX family)
MKHEGIGWGWVPNRMLSVAKEYSSVLLPHPDVPNMFLVAHHQNKPEPRWRFPGGKIELEETPIGCAARELYEEVGVVAHCLKLLHCLDRDIDGELWHGHYFICTQFTGKPTIREPNKFDKLMWLNGYSLRQHGCQPECDIAEAISEPFGHLRQLSNLIESAEHG